jgi:hypothetical protein
MIKELLNAILRPIVGPLIGLGVLVAMYYLILSFFSL